MSKNQRLIDLVMLGMIVIHLSKKKKVPNDVQFKLPKIPDLPVLGTKTTDLEDYSKSLDSTKLESMLQALK